MKVSLHPHAKERLTERGATETEVNATVTGGEQFPAKFGRIGFRRNFAYQSQWRGRFYTTKQILAFADRETDRWLVITVIVRYF